MSKTENINPNLFYGKSNDVIIPASGETAEDISTAFCVLPNDIIFGGDLNVLRSHHNGSFLSYQLNGVRKFEIAKFAVGKSVVHLHNEELKNLVCFFPENINEENKIVAFMDLIDSRIETQNKIIEDLKTYRNSLIDKYFKNCNSRISLKEVLKERNMFSKKGLEFEHVTLSKEGIVPKSERYERDFLVKDNSKEYKITKLNDICYNPANLKFGVICINEYGDSIFSPIYVTFEVEKFDPYYVSLYLTNKNFINYILKYQQGTVYERMAVSPEDLVKGQLPYSDKANSFTKLIRKIDLKINNEINILKKYYSRKTYMLQNLFI